MNSQEIDEIVQHLENAKYIGASKAVQIIHQLNKDRSRLEQRAADLEARIERMVEKQSHYEAMAHAGGFEAGVESVTKENEPVAWISVLGIDHIGQKFTDVRVSLTKTDVADIPLYTHPAKTLTDEEWNKAFDCYCETDEGVLRFGYELREEWKKEQLIRWKEALKKAQEQDGVSLSVINHPIGEPVNEDKGLNPESLETIEIELPDTPAKTLTSEEIEAEWFKVFEPEAGLGKNLTNGIFEFARAILKKASEK
jgi:hypothetical protein